MTNEMMCQIFEKGYKGWEMKGMSRADIAVELEKTVSFFFVFFFFRRCPCCECQLWLMKEAGGSVHARVVANLLYELEDEKGPFCLSSEGGEGEGKEKK